MFQTINMLDCLGVCQVANNKETDTNEIQVNLPGDFPSQDGENIATAEEILTVHYTSTGDTKQGKVLMGNTVPATWMPLNTNRITAPDVREGSEVVVYQFKNTNKYLWTLYGLNGSMRLETIVYAISASPNIDENTPITPDNYYILTVSSHQKKIELITGQGNGEACSYQITLDLGKGYYGTMDGFGNILMNNAVERSLSYVNKDKTQLSIDKKNFTLINLGDSLIDTQESVTVRSKNITFLAQENFYLKAGHGKMEFDNELAQSVGADFTTTIGGSGSVTASANYTIKASQIDLTAPTVNASAKLTAGKAISSPSIEAGGQEMYNHIHGVIDHSYTTPPRNGSRATSSITVEVHDETDPLNTPFDL